MRVSSVALLLVLTTGVLAAQSQPPTPRPSVGSQAPQQQPTPQNNGPDRNETPVVAVDGQEQTSQPEQDAAEGNPQTAGNGWFTANGANWAIVLLTFVLAVIGGLQWWATHTANRHYTVIERAYVTMSLVGKLGFDKDGGAISFRYEIKNRGRTPATVLGGRMYLVFKEPDEGAPTGSEVLPGSGVPRMFLVPDSRMLLGKTIKAIGAVRINRAVQGDDVLGLVNIPHLELWMIGHVDYRDQFGTEYRAGFGRHYNRSEGELLFDETTTHLNYDRLLSRDERVGTGGQGRHPRQPHP